MPAGGCSTWRRSAAPAQAQREIGIRHRRCLTTEWGSRIGLLNENTAEGSILARVSGDGRPQDFMGAFRPAARPAAYFPRRMRRGREFRDCNRAAPGQILFCMALRAIAPFQYCPARHPTETKGSSSLLLRRCRGFSSGTRFAEEHFVYKSLKGGLSQKYGPQFVPPGVVSRCAVVPSVGLLPGGLLLYTCARAPARHAPPENSEGSP